MIDLLFWFLVSQTVAGLPDMAPGTEVKLVSLDLVTVYASAQVRDHRLVMTGDFAAEGDVRLLILQPDASPQATVEALGNQALVARLSPQGDDILVQFEELDGPLSFKKWLAEERGITLEINPKGEGQ